MTSSFKILFAIDFINEYYENLQCKDFDIIPSPETSDLLKKYKMIYKLVGNKLIILTKINDQDKPFVTIDTNQKFIFFMSLNNPAFMNITNIDFEEIKSKRFYFSNLSENIFDNALYLSSVIENHDMQKTYKTGSFVNDGNIIFESLKSGNKGNLTSNSTFWRSRNNFQYVSQKDMIRFGTSILDYTSPVESSDFFINVFALSKLSGLFNIPVKTEKQTFSKPTKDIQIDLINLPKGKYKFIINSDEFSAYIDSDAVYGNSFGIIEIFSHLPGNNEFALLDDKNKVKADSKKYTYAIRFANRMAFWKYFTPKHSVKSITDSTTTFVFKQNPDPSPDPAYFQSTELIPITEKPKKFNLDLKNPISSDPLNAPNPDPKISGMLTSNDNKTEFFYNTYLNY